MSKFLIGIGLVVFSFLYMAMCLVFAGAVYAVMAVPLYFAWKWVAVASFAAPALGFWQVFAACWGIGVLAGLFRRIKAGKGKSDV